MALAQLGKKCVGKNDSSDPVNTCHTEQIGTRIYCLGDCSLSVVKGKTGCDADGNYCGGSSSATLYKYKGSCGGDNCGCNLETDFTYELIPNPCG